MKIKPAADRVPELAAVIEARDRQAEDVDAKPFVPEEKDRLKALLEDELHRQIAPTTDAAVARAQKPHDVTLGQLRAQLLAPDDAGAMVRELKAMRLSAQAANAEHPVAIFDDVELAGDDLVTRTVGVATAARLRALQARDAGKAVSKHRDQLLAFTDRFARWQKAHPSIAEQIKEAERQRAVAETLTRADAQHVLDMHRIRARRSAPVLAPQPEAEDSRIKVGSAFDLLNRNKVRR